MIIFFRLHDALRPLEEEQRQTNERLARLQHSMEVMMYQQRERDQNSNINRDMVLLVRDSIVLIELCYRLNAWLKTLFISSLRLPSVTIVF